MKKLKKELKYRKAYLLLVSLFLVRVHLTNCGNNEVCNFSTPLRTIRIRYCDVGISSGAYRWCRHLANASEAAPATASLSFRSLWCHVALTS